YWRAGPAPQATDPGRRVAHGAEHAPAVAEVVEQRRGDHAGHAVRAAERKAADGDVERNDVDAHGRRAIRAGIDADHVVAVRDAVHRVGRLAGPVLHGSGRRKRVRATEADAAGLERGVVKRLGQRGG